MAKEVSFEKALEKLEGIVGELESGELTLEEALKQYEEGVKLTRVCQKNLSEAEKKIEILTKNLDGSFDTEDFEDEKPKAKKRKSSKTEDDLII